MTHEFQSFSTPAYASDWILRFAQESDQDLELDDGLDDLDDRGPKPPSRRPLIIILLLLLVAGAAYFAMNPHLLSPITGMIAAPGSQTIEEHSVSGGAGPHSTPDQSVAPSPAFEEGEVVTVVANRGNLSPIALGRDAQRSEPGPQVQVGELLTIVDGAFIDQSWMYLVNTKSGAKGWINEQHIQSPS